MWQEIEEDSDSVSARLKVPGGWVVRTIVLASRGAGVTQIFVSDPDYKWELEVKKKK